MTKTTLAVRLKWLENGHEDAPEFNHAMARKLLGMTMRRYFFGKATPISDLARYLDMPLETVWDMTYADVIAAIRERYDKDGHDRKMAIEASWVLAAPLIVEGRRRLRRK